MTERTGNGAALEIARLDEALEGVRRFLPQPTDDARTIQTKSKLVLQTAEIVVGQAKEIVKRQAISTQRAIYVRAADTMDGVERVTIAVADATLHLAVGAGLAPADFVPGQYVEVSADSTCVTATDPALPLEGDVVDVVSVPIRGEHGEVWVEVESGAQESRHRVMVSGFVTQPVEEGMKVRVHRGFLYEVIRTRAARDTDYLDECQLHVDPHDPRAVDFARVKGQTEAVRRLRLVLDRALAPEQYPGTAALGGAAYLLVGLPGQGKTMLARAAALELERRLGKRAKTLYIRSASVLNKWVGASEQRLRSVFDTAIRDHEERGIFTLIIFDEADSLLVGREHFDSTGTRGSVTTTLLTYLDGAVPLPRGLMILALSNFEGRIDKALLRSQRLGGGRRIELGRIPEAASLEIISAELERDRSVLNGSPIAELVEAVRAANDTVLGTCVVGKETVSIRGRHVQGGSSARGAIDTALDLLHEHLFEMRDRGRETPFSHLTPALLFEGARRTLHGVLSSNAGEANLERARELLSGSLVHPDEVGSLLDVRCLPLGEVSVPAEYDLGVLRALEAP
jgi:ATP-dependent 26S proteasome regulatory subunit